MARNAGLTRELIVQSGLQCCRDVGLSRVTLQRVAEPLGVTPEAIAYYLPRATLHAEIADLAVSEIEYPAIESGTYDIRLRQLAYSWQETMQRYPGVQGFVASYPRMLPQVRRIVDSGLNDLVASGFDETEAKLLYGLYHAFFIGWNMLRSAPERAAAPGGAEGDRRQAGSMSGRYSWTRAEPLFDFGIESLLTIMRRAQEGDWLPSDLMGVPAPDSLPAV